MFKIPLSQNQFAVVDEDDFLRFGHFVWSARWQPRTRSFDVVRKKDGKMVYMSREVTGAEKGLVVDHRNHDTLNNRKSNLRICVKKDNNRNRRKPITNKSGYKGVFRYPGRLTRPWAARIKVNAKQIHLGYFADPKEAAVRYDRAAIEHFGEFAFLNFGGSNVQAS